MRHLLVVLALALPLAASGQITHAVADGVWFIDGTDGPDAAFIECNEGNAQVNSTNPAGGPVACTLITRFEIRLGNGADFGVIIDTPDFGLDPITPSTLDGGPDADFFQFDLSDLTQDLTVRLHPTATFGGLFEVSVQRGENDFFNLLIHDPTLGLDLIHGSGNDRIVVDIDPPDPGLELLIFGGPGEDVLDGRGGGVHLPLTFLGEDDDDVLISGPQATSLGWNPGDGTDRFVGGDGRNEVRIFGGDAFSGIHQIGGFLGPACAFFDFLGGGGVVDEGIDDATFFPGAGGIDLFVEFDCSVDNSKWNGNAGPDRSFLRGREGGGNDLELDFEFDTAIFTDGFESGDISSWSTGRDLGRSGDTLWDGLDYQDWPSFTDPSTSGPSRVVIRGRPDFPVTLDMGPDGAAGRGGAVDTLRVDPLGLPFTDDGSQIVIDGGPPITYRGVEVVDILGATAAEEIVRPTRMALSIFPNPSVGSARVRLEAPGAREARVVVLDVLGREVAVLHDGPVGANAVWTLPQDPMTPGTYMVLAHGPGWAASQKVVVTE